MLDRLLRNWIYGGFLAALVLFALTPLMARDWPETLLLTFLFLPLYMCHQFEEHDADRFRLFFNATLGRGLEVLTPPAVFLINVPGVWGVIAVACYFSADIRAGYGLIAVYLAVVNGIVHIVHALIFRSYNPGLATAICLFLPAGGYTIARFNALGAGDGFSQIVGVGSAVVIHAMIVVYALRRRAALSRAT